MNIIIETTTDDEIVAKSISNELLNNNLSSCVQIINNINSNYIWKNKQVSSNEILIRIKTSFKLCEKVIELIKKLHNYDIPELISYNFNINSNKYKQWFNNSLNK